MLSREANGNKDVERERDGAATGKRVQPSSGVS
jgi:hypothetical protein